MASEVSSSSLQVSFRTGDAGLIGRLEAFLDSHFCVAQPISIDSICCEHNELSSAHAREILTAWLVVRTASTAAKRALLEELRNWKVDFHSISQKRNAPRSGGGKQVDGHQLQGGGGALSASSVTVLGWSSMAVGDFVRDVEHQQRLTRTNRGECWGHSTLNPRRQTLDPRRQTPDAETSGALYGVRPPSVSSVVWETVAEEMLIGRSAPAVVSLS